MPSSPHEVLALAEEIADKCKGEAALRSAASRAYYAALMAAQATIPSLTNDGPTHERIIRSCVKYGQGANPGRRASSEMAGLLEKVKVIRTEADYYLETEFTQRQYKDALVQARRVLTLCDVIETARKQGGAAPAPISVIPTVATVQPDTPAPTPPPRPGLLRVK
jgi:uncharacterized protein (UPF0332 family)